MAENDARWHALEAAEAVALANSNVREGLAESEVTERLARFGPNALPEARRAGWTALVLRQFRSPLIYLLLLACVAAYLMEEHSDAAVILVVVLLNAAIGALQEGRAERSLAALRRIATLRARVLRSGSEQLIAAHEVVPGDVLVLDAGDEVSADARLLDGAALEVAEAALTGESVPVAKTRLAPLAPDTPVADRENMVFAGTHVTAGRARALVVATGVGTQIGRIAQLTDAAIEPLTPLEERVARLGRRILVAAALLFAAVNGIGAWRGLPAGEIVMVAISQVVGMIPEGLPVAMTIALAVGVQRMARRGALVRRLSAVETLGSTSVICSDKTGTLTRNEMTVTRVYLPGSRDVRVSGVGWAPEGDLAQAGRELSASGDSDLRALLEAGVLCNDAQLIGPDDANPHWQVVGDPTEAALLTLATKAGLSPKKLRAEQPRSAELPFDPAAKLMATQHRVDGNARVYLKGAPEILIESCSHVLRGGRVEPLDAQARREARAAAEHMAGLTLRVLAIARIEAATLDPQTGFPGLTQRATLLGLVGAHDPPREEVAEAVRACASAGIRPVMVTGDHKATGLAIARTLGIAGAGDVALDSRELDALGDDALGDALDRISVFARVHPAQKLRIVEAFQSRGHVVAMTGDGVNDAPALARADVGVAMGRTGTEVAKQAAKVVVTDDNFATIVAAVEGGRLVFRNISKAVLYLISTSIAEVTVLLVALLCGYPPPLAAVQILWINLVTEGTVTVNLVMDRGDASAMRRRPIARSEPLLSRAMLGRAALLSIAISASTLGWFVTRLSAGVPFADAQSETFTVLAVCQWFNVLNCRSENTSALRLGLFGNRWLLAGILLSNLLQLSVIYIPAMNRVFHTVPIDVGEFFAIGAVASAVLWVEELRKLWVRRRAAPDAGSRG